MDYNRQTNNTITKLHNNYITKENHYGNSISCLQLRVLQLKETILENNNSKTRPAQERRQNSW